MRKSLVEFLLITFALYAANSYMVIKIIQLKCEPNPEFFTNVTCKLKPINRYKAVVDLDFYIKDILKNFTLQFRTFVQNDRNHFHPFVINVDGNLCDGFDQPKLSIVCTIIRNYAAKFSNMNHSCPYTGHAYGRDFWLDEKFLPTFMVPPGIYKGLFRLFEGWPYVSIANVTAAVQVMDVRKDRYDKYNH